VALILAPLLALAGLLDHLVPYRHPLVDLLAERRDGTALAAVIVSAVIAAPGAEEFFFRRVLQGWLEKRFPEPSGVTAIVLSAAAFALAHQGQGLAYVPLLPFGLVLGTLARQTGSIVACIVAHALFNAISVGIVLMTT
jgi:membrane protease YdiL (CAAX protease family)